MNGRISGLCRSFCFAARGVRHCVRRERNFRIHLTAAAWVLWLAWILRVGGGRLAVLVLTIAAVLAAELINTAIEAVVDLASPDIHPLAALAKDAAAAAVLVWAAAAVVVGVLLLWQPPALRALFHAAIAAPAGVAVFAAVAGLSVWFIFCGGAEGKGKESL